jgi:hypothetical protein
MTGKMTDLVPATVLELRKSVGTAARRGGLRCSVCTAFAEPSDVEFVQHRVRGTSSDLVRQKLTCNQAERCAAVSERDVETCYLVDAAEDGFPVTGNRLRADSTPGGLEPRRAF